MKRYGNIHDEIANIDNVNLADKLARRSKKNIGIVKHDKNREYENKLLTQSLKNLSYRTSQYDKFKIYEPKERIIYRLPYYPDRIAHHALMNKLEPIWTKIFIPTTYSCIKGRGIHKCAKDVKRALTKHPDETIYCLKLDITKFYPSINHDILKSIIRRKLKDKNTLVILDGIIDSADGVPIGNYLSQFFANLYLTYFDHWLKEDCHVKFYFRYADDIVILHNNKRYLHNLLIAIKFYLHLLLKLDVKGNYQIFPVDKHGIDFVGYKFYHTHTMLRKSIKGRMMKLVHKFERGAMNLDTLKTKLSSYFGWMKYCNSKHLLSVIQVRTSLKFSNWQSSIVSQRMVAGKNIRIIELADYAKNYEIHFIYKRHSYTTNSTDKFLYTLLNGNMLNFKFI